MQIVFNNVDGNFNTIADPDASLVADENAAAAILDSMFSDNITLTFDIGVGFNPDPDPKAQPLTGAGIGNANVVTTEYPTYDELRTALLASGQPGFFTDTNLPAGDDINGISNFWISSAQAKALEIPTKDGVDGYIGIATNLAGDDRIATILHEVGHAMGRTSSTTLKGITYYPEMDLVRFISQDNRQFIAAPGAYFSIDGGATPLVNLGNMTFSDFLNPPNVPGAPKVDPYSEIIITGGGTLATLTPLDIQVMEALGFTFPVMNPAPAAAAQAVASSSDPTSMLDPAPATTANMVTRNVTDTTTTYAMYNLGANTVLAANSLGQVGSEFEFVTLGNFNETDPSDMLLRNSTSGAFQVFDIEDNNVVGAFSLGEVGVEWQPLAFGFFNSFGSFGETDMLMRRSDGELEVYNIDDNQVVGSAFMGNVGVENEFSGIGNFGSSGNSDMLLRNSITGDLQVYNISDNEVTGSEFMGNIGVEWQFSGVGNFSSVPGESDLLLRNSITGDLQVYDISNNEVTGSSFMGNVGLEWQFAGVAPVLNDSSSDLILRNVNTGDFQVYNIADNQVTGFAPLGNVGVEWQLGGFAPIGSVPQPEMDLPPQPRA